MFYMLIIFIVLYYITLFLYIYCTLVYSLLTFLNRAHLYCYCIYTHSTYTAPDLLLTHVVTDYF